MLYLSAFQLISVSEIPIQPSDQLNLQSEKVLHVDLGENSDELLQRCILANCRFSIRIPETTIATQVTDSAERSGSRIEATTSFDLRQILEDISELFLENRARISYRVFLSFPL